MRVGFFSVLFLCCIVFVLYCVVFVLCCIVFYVVRKRVCLIVLLFVTKTTMPYIKG